MDSKIWMMEYGNLLFSLLLYMLENFYDYSDKNNGDTLRTEC